MPPMAPMLYRPCRDDEIAVLAVPMTAPRYFRTAARFSERAHLGLRPEAPRGGRKMGESDLLVGPHSEGGTGLIASIGVGH